MAEKQREKVCKCATPECPYPGVSEQADGEVLCPKCDASGLILKYAMERETR